VPAAAQQIRKRKVLALCGDMDGGTSGRHDRQEHDAERALTST